MLLNQFPRMLLNLLIRTLELISLAVRLPIVVLLLANCVLFQQYVAPLVKYRLNQFCVFPKYLQRYVPSITNLVLIRLALLLLGVTSIKHEGFCYFRKRHYAHDGFNMNKHLIFRSGSVGVGINNNFVDFLYYACMFNPIFCTLLEYYEEPETNKRKLYYIPMTFRQAIFGALKPHGFDPIVAKSKHEFMKIKSRKVQLKTLLSESQRDVLGPILTFLPQASPNTILDMPTQIYEGMITNYQGGYQREGIAFNPQLYTIPSHSKFNSSSGNEYLYLVKLCSQFNRFTMRITMEKVQGARHSRSYRFSQRHIINISEQNENIINKFYNKQGYKTISKSWRQYSQQIVVENSKNIQQRVQRKRYHGKNKNKLKLNRSFKQRKSNELQMRQADKRLITDNRRMYQKGDESILD